MKSPALRQRRIFVLAAFLCASGIANSQQELPDGPGKEQVEQMCTGCHSLQPIVTVRHTTAEWRAEVGNMVGLGAEVPDADQDAIVEYLSDRYGKGSKWPLYGVGAGALFGLLILGRSSWRRRKPKVAA